MHDAEWTGNAGTDQWNVGIAHSNSFDVEVLVYIPGAGECCEMDFDAS